MLAHEDLYKPNISKAIFEGGTVLGSLFVLATPMVQIVAHETGHGSPATWKSFKATAPKAAALGLALGAVGNGYFAARDYLNWEFAKKEALKNWDHAAGRGR